MEKMYSIALRKRNDSNDRFWNHEEFFFEDYKIDCKGRYWLADPFLFEKDGEVYVFYEAYDLIELKGKIGYSILENGYGTPPNIILDKDYHLSFPNIFVVNNDVYIMPESCEDYTLRLFRAIDFPNKWIEDKILISEIFTCDSVLFPVGNKNYLITSEMYHKVPNALPRACWVKNRIMELDQNYNPIDKGIIIGEGDYGIRNGGKMIEENGKIVRVGQNCIDGIYGQGLVLFEVEEICPYKEREIFNVNAKEFANHLRSGIDTDIIGIHTYNSSENYEVVDYSFRDNPPISTRIRRKMNRIKNAI